MMRDVFNNQRYLPRGIRLRRNVCSLYLVSVVTGAWIYFVSRMNPVDKENTKDLILSSHKYHLFQSADEEDFPTTEGHVPRIPHIIHQIYEDEMIPAMYINHVKSFIKYNPTWEYRFWSDESGRRLLQKHHPYLVQVYDNFGKSVMRSDLLRYAVLYEYGGFYADLDMDNLRSLNRTTMKYACIVPVEPFEHSVLLENAIFLMNNAIMGCRPKHPFFKLLLSDLRTAKPGEDPVGSTGPRYITRKFIQYNHIGPSDANRTKTDLSSNSPYFYKGELKEECDDSVYVPNSQYFMDNLDPMHVTEDGKFTKLCKYIDTLPYLSKRACSELNRRRYIREEKKYTFTVHHWYHLWLKKKLFSELIRNKELKIDSVGSLINQALVTCTKTENTKDLILSSHKYHLFQSADEEDFPTTEGHVPRIPHIIHQIYEDEMIPAMYINHVKSFIKYNPTWEYRFWSDESGRRLLQKHHPYLVQVYDNFGKSVMRSDLLRYAVLYEYGGFYADLDMDNLRSLNRTTMKYACIVPVEPFEHSVLLENAIFLMNNAIMGCRPKHPFFKLLLSDLRTAKPGEDPVGSTGPRYVTRKFIQYNRIRPLDANRTKTDWSSNSPYFYKGELKEDDNDAVYVPNSQYFMDNLDPIHVTEDGKFTKLCNNTVTLPYLSQRACSEFYRRRDIREEKKYTFTVHHWYHLWLKKKSAVNNLQKVNIKDVVQNFISYYG